MNEPNGKATRLDARTWVPIGLLASLLVTAIYGTASVVTNFSDLKNTQQELVKGQADGAAATAENTDAVRDLTESVGGLKRDLSDLSGDRWRASDMRYLWLATQQALDRAGVKVDLPL